MRRQQTVDVPLPDAVAAENAHKLYQPLHPWQTRIIDLHPGKPGDSVQCDLLVADLIADNGVGLSARSKIVHYEAISYSLGWPALTSTIICNSIRHGVPPGLFEALTYLRYEHDHRFLWADALVVNQHDDVEKASQMQRMLMIFEKAWRVVAWLGTATMETDMLFNVMAKQTIELERPNSDDKSLSKQQERLADTGRDIGHLALAANVHDAECAEAIGKIQDVVAAFFKRRWFHRTWIR